MSSYKGHTIFALVLALMFFNNPLIIALSVIGANIPDFDHKFKKDNVYKMIILGLIVFISLYLKIALLFRFNNSIFRNCLLFFPAQKFHSLYFRCTYINCDSFFNTYLGLWNSYGYNNNSYILFVYGYSDSSFKLFIPE